MSFLGADIVYDHADYRLLSKRATENLLDFDEVNLFFARDRTNDRFSEHYCGV